MCLAAATPFSGMSPAEVTAFQKGMASQPFATRLHRVVAAELGTPYQDGPLGEGPGAKYDDDPLVDLGHVDCVTFVEQSVAFAAAGDYPSAVDLLQKIRYKADKVDFGARNHFMIADWAANNAWCTDISQKLGVPTAASTRTIDRKAFFEKQGAPECGAGIPAEQLTLHYVPSANGAAAEAKLPDAAILVFIGKIEWLFALHCGVYLRAEDGSGALYHASSKAGKATTVPLAQYLDENKNRYLGFTAYAVASPLATATSAKP